MALCSGRSAARSSQARRSSLRRRAGGECAPPTWTPRPTGTCASISQWVSMSFPALPVAEKKKKPSDQCLHSGGGECDPGESHENDVTVYGKSEGRRERVVLDTLPYSSYRVRSTLERYPLTKHLTQFNVERLISYIRIIKAKYIFSIFTCSFTIDHL